jgi:cellulose synthase (UDP-forming)
MALSVRLSAAGWRLVNLAEPLSVGMAAEEIGSYIDQRLRWTRGNMQVLFSRESSPLFLRGLTLAQRALYVFGSFGFFSMGFVRLAFLTLPLSYLLFGLVLLRATLEDLVFYQLPFFLLNNAAAAWLRGGTRSALWDDVYATLLCFPQALTVLETLARPFGAGFRVTPKGVDVRALRWNARAGAPLVAMAVLLAGGLVWRLAFDGSAPADPAGLAVVYFFAAYNLVYLWIAIQATFDCPQERTGPRVREALPCTLRPRLVAAATGDPSLRPGEPLRGRTVDLSEHGALLEVPGADSRALAGATLDIDGAHLFGLPIATSRDAGGGRVGVRFGPLALEQERRLVEHLFCRSGIWGCDRVDEVRSSWALVKTIFRLYPLAATR